MLKKVVFCLFILSIIICCVVTCNFYRELENLKRMQEKDNQNHIETRQFLMATINWSTQRQKTVLYMRDRIIREWKILKKPLDYNKAYTKAEAILNECEKYPGLQPFTLLAVQCIESRFCDTAKSDMGALGSWQIMPSTARLLCALLNISYTDKIFFDPLISTRFAGRLFGALYATYDNEEQVIADYNGGPWQAYFYKHDKGRLVKETEDFVMNVKNKRDDYANNFMAYKTDSVFVHR